MTAQIITLPVIRKLNAPAPESDPFGSELKQIARAGMMCAAAVGVQVKLPTCVELWFTHESEAQEFCETVRQMRAIPTGGAS